jgi:exopolysaccharide biosynthesis protein
MENQTRTPNLETEISPEGVTIRPRGAGRRAAKKKANAKQTVFRILRRTGLSILTLVLVLVIGLSMILNLIFNGPSEAACKVLTMSLLEASATKWVPGLFIGADKVESIRNGGSDLFVDSGNDDDVQIEINTDTSLNGNTDEWKNYPDGIRIEDVSGDTYNAHVMIIRDPSRVYLATSSDNFSTSKQGTRITQQIETEGAVAAINAGAFFDDGTSSPTVGAYPEGLVISEGAVVWKSGKAPQEGFVGFNNDNVMIVAKSMTADKAMEIGIRDGCCFGPVLIMNGAVNEEAYNAKSGLNPRTAIGQRADGAVIFLCIDGRQASSMGGTYADIIDIMVEYGAVNACNLDGGSSTVMLYRDYETGEVSMINSYSLLQEKPRRMPTFIMVRPESEG